MRTVISGARVILPDRIAAGWSVVVEGGRIAAVGPDSHVRRRRGDEVTRAAGRYLAPGFIDLHVHGVHGQLAAAGPEALAAMIEILPRYGVTGVLPTLAGLSVRCGERRLTELAAAHPRGARVLGFHLEGPFLALGGAIPRRALARPDLRLAMRFVRAARPHRTIFSVSPELPGAVAMIRGLVRTGAAVFLTHTRATARQTDAAIYAGARHATHFYDVWPVPEETEPGVRPAGAVESVLADARVSVDFILDGEHVDPAAVKAALACKGPGRVCLATDANVGAGLGAGRYRFAEQEIVIPRRGAAARLGRGTSAPGALAGSGLTMDRALRNAVAMLGLDLPAAVRMASTSPAAVLGLGGHKGRIAPGFDADLVLLSPSLRVAATWVDGILRWARPGTIGPMGGVHD